MITTFLHDDSGAVAVDWVVMTASVTALGLAVAVVVSGGTEDLASDTSAALSGTEIAPAFSPLRDLMNVDFSSGEAGWSGGTKVNVAGFGEVLRIGPNGLAQASVAVPDGARQATISFDLIGADDLSGVPATIYINNQPVAIYRDNHGAITHVDSSGAGVSVAVQQLYENEAMGSGSHGHDSRATYTITVDDPGTELTLGIENGSGQPITEEFYAIDDVAITAR